MLKANVASVASSSATQKQAVLPLRAAAPASGVRAAAVGKVRTGRIGRHRACAPGRARDCAKGGLHSARRAKTDTGVSSLLLSPQNNKKQAARGALLRAEVAKRAGAVVAQVSTSWQRARASRH